MKEKLVPIHNIYECEMYYTHKIIEVGGFYG
jgi:hypothetical protein